MGGDSWTVDGDNNDVSAGVMRPRMVAHHPHDVIQRRRYLEQTNKQTCDKRP
jgi:hypothetical protein